jgi:hypothetical protein
MSAKVLSGARRARAASQPWRNHGWATNNGEKQPDQNHGVEPPIGDRHEFPPEIEAMDHIEPADTRDQGCPSSLRGEAALDGIKEDKLLLRFLQTPHGRQQYGCDHGDAADPQHNGWDMNRDHDVKVIHAFTTIQIYVVASMMKYRSPRGFWTIDQRVGATCRADLGTS